ncbi:MAG: TylF/MycF/NovP-related O-methyltransferase [Phycisphaeraceae bacterium]
MLKRLFRRKTRPEAVVYRNVAGKRVPFSDLYEMDEESWNNGGMELRFQQDLDAFFWRAFMLLRMNRTPGDYVEFGCGSNIRSFRFALKYNRALPYDRKLWAFDSFQGLPVPTGIDEHQQWRQGQMAVTLEQFEQVMAHYDAEQGRDFHCVPGFFEQTLRNRSLDSYGIERVAFAHIDCDLYSSTLDCLRSVLPVMAHGAVLAFDDWYCFDGDPARGEQRAFHEISAAFADRLSLMRYLPFGWHGQAFLVHHRDRLDAAQAEMSAS